MKARLLIRHAAQRLATFALVLGLGYLTGFGASTLSHSHSSDASPAAVESPTQNPGASDATADGDAPAATDAASSPAQGAAEADGTSYQPSPVAYTNWDEDESPNYYRELGAAQVGEQPAAGTVRYGRLDRLGRATGAVATVTYESMQAGRERGRSDTSEIIPSGWGHNSEVDIAMPGGTVYHGQLFNRSHLVAKSLGGEERIENLICGTRTQNVGANVGGHEGGMAYAEGLARDWLERHRDGTLYYAATPAYEGSELVARSVIVDLRSSDGELDRRIEAYNATRGFAIDYATGTFQVTENASSAARDIASTTGTKADGDNTGEAASEGSAVVEPTGSPEAEDGERKVIVTRSGKAYHHDQDCKGLNNARSMEWVTVSEAERMGRRPCSICGG